MPINIASIVKFYTVLLLMEKPKHGYELMKELEGRIGKTVSPSQVYPFLAVLEKEGLIKVERTGKRDKVVYSLTRKGLDFTNKMLSRSGDLFYLALRPRITSCAHCGCKILEGGFKTKIKGKEVSFCCHFCAKSFHKGCC